MPRLKNPSKKYIVCQPLPYWPFETPTRLRTGIWVRSAPAFDDFNETFWRYSFSGKEFNDLKSCHAWLWCEFVDDFGFKPHRRERAIQLIRNLFLLIQLACPTGSSVSAVCVFEQSENLNLVQVDRAATLNSSTWTGMLGFADVGIEDLRLLVRRGLAAFKKNEIRLVNPLYMLELGLQATNIHIRVLLWVTALDALLVAQNQGAFERRINNLLGSDTFVFPRIRYFAQPKYRIKEVAADLYELRSQIAHGRRISEKFREHVLVSDPEGHPIDGYHQQQYRDVLHECSLLVLILSLRKSLNDDRLRTVRKTRDWINALEQPLTCGP